MTATQNEYSERRQEQESIFRLRYVPDKMRWAGKAYLSEDRLLFYRWLLSATDAALFENLLPSEIVCIHDFRIHITTVTG
jgi:hypothetical protein